MALKRIVVVEPSGFCAGVKRAVDMVDRALSVQGAPLYCYRELVHNRQVVDDFAARGVIFVTALADVPAGSTLVFSAHGVAPELYAEATRRGVHILDATCLFVTRIHTKVRQYARAGCQIFLVGHRGHDEVIGVVGEAPGHIIVIENPAEAEAVQVPIGIPLALVTQTTLSVSDTEKTIAVLCRRFPSLATLPQNDICLAVRNRQLGVIKLAAQVDRVLVLGGRNSSNSLRLVEVARAAGAEASLISNVDNLQNFDWRETESVGITAGASTPDSFVHQVIDGLKRLGDVEVTRLCVEAEELTSTESPATTGGGYE